MNVCLEWVPVNARADGLPVESSIAHTIQSTTSGGDFPSLDK